jgi:hypothetical protein
MSEHLALVTVKKLPGDVFCDEDCLYLDTGNDFCDLVFKENGASAKGLHVVVCGAKTLAAEVLADQAERGERMWEGLTAAVGNALGEHGHAATVRAAQAADREA